MPRPHHIPVVEYSASDQLALRWDRRGLANPRVKPEGEKTLAACKDTSKRAGKKISLRLQLTCGKAARFGERIPAELTRGKTARFRESSCCELQEIALETLHASCAHAARRQTSPLLSQLTRARIHLH